MTDTYTIVGPDKRAYDTATSWNGAVDKAVDWSLKWGVLFRVINTAGNNATFLRERAKVLKTSMEYIEMARLHPKSVATEKAKIRFEAAKSKLDAVLEVQRELAGSDFAERHAMSHPVKAFRTDI